MTNTVVSVVRGRGTIGYPPRPPFHPPTDYPEYPFSDYPLDPSNRIYPLVRDLLFTLGLDESHFDTKEWNPLGSIIHPGDKVVIKPNFVLHFNASGQDVEAVITHGSVIRAVMDYVFVALQGRGKIVIADAPQMNAHFGVIMDATGIGQVVDFYIERTKGSELKVALVDLRREMTRYKYGIVWERIPLKGDPEGYVIVDLGDWSETKGIDCSKVYGADYNRRETVRAHRDGSHMYCIGKTILDADVIISIPKLKVHSKAGVTLNLKNMVGISGNKNYILHYRVGPSVAGGDELSETDIVRGVDRKLRDLLLGRFWKWGKYPYALWSATAYRFLKRVLCSSAVFEKGNWHGNDTVWRAALDLNKILFYADKEGKLQDQRQRRYFSMIDGIIGGEGEGPLAPTPKYCGVLIGGINPVLVDIVGTRLMGLDYAKIPLLREAFEIQRYSLVRAKAKDITVRSNASEWQGVPSAYCGCYEFEPPRGWQGHIELGSRRALEEPEAD